MTKIQVTPEQLTAVSNQFSRASEQSSQLIEQLSRQLSSLESRWNGITQQQFFHDFHRSRALLGQCVSTMQGIGQELNTIAVRFSQADGTSDGAMTGGNSNGTAGVDSSTGTHGSDPTAGASTGSTNGAAHDGTVTSSVIGGMGGGLGLRDNLEKYGTAFYSGVAAAMVLSGTVGFNRKPGHHGRAVIHTAQWVKGRGSNEFMKKMARSMDKQFHHPGRVLSALKGFDKWSSKLGVNFGLGLNRANNFPHWVKNVVVGVNQNQSGMKTNKIPGMIAKKLFPINVTFNVASEGLGVVEKWHKGTLTAEEGAVAASNVIVKSGATYVGALAGGTLGLIGGPVGAAVGAYVGGTVGSFAGDHIAPVVEKGLRWLWQKFK
ncbi:WXG100 family type VII secretion target [Paenibacillus sp. 481]|uniref:WXG100 family type VII secretion target n=1 Tax=Paenibacillus sp. 481 TaxID=2835869 RepID=UPI001E2CCA49|nr:WXG100 family type VII secretion target [Paenibacillus sp. 481]UHA72123.1 WXG100 family type VII secretion target [Paenibacillus sp. 481]